MKEGLEITHQSEAPPALWLLNRPATPATRDKPGQYFYAATAGRGITVYILDSQTHDLGPSHYRVEPRWLYADGLRFMTNHDHPAKVASLIASEEEGVAKNAAIVFVPMMAGQTLEVPIRYILQALEAIIADVKAKKLQGKAVINVSISTLTP